MNAKVAGKSGGQGASQGSKAVAALEGHYRCHVQNKATGQWFELQVNTKEKKEMIQNSDISSATVVPYFYYKANPN